MVTFSGQLSPRALLPRVLCKAQAGHQDRKACIVQKVRPSSSTKPEERWGPRIPQGLRAQTGLQWSRGQLPTEGDLPAGFWGEVRVRILKTQEEYFLPRGAKEKLLRGKRMEESLGTKGVPMWHGFQKGEEGGSWKSFRKNYEIKVCKHLWETIIVKSHWA